MDNVSGKEGSESEKEVFLLIRMGRNGRKKDKSGKGKDGIEKERMRACIRWTKKGRRE